MFKKSIVLFKTYNIWKEYIICFFIKDIYNELEYMR